MSPPTSLTILSITKTIKPRAATTSATMEKTQREFLPVSYMKPLSLLYKKHTELSPLWSLLKRLYPLPKSAVAITRKAMPNISVATTIICNS